MAIETEIMTKNNFELIIQLVDSIIWPLTLLLVLLTFRRNLSDVILRLGTLKADRTGFELSFDKKIEATKKLFQQIKPATISKTGGDIQAFNEENDSPFGRILKTRSNLINYLKVLSEKNNIQGKGLMPEQLSEKLKDTGVITIQQMKMINAMLEVTAAANASATDRQARDVDNLMKKIEIN